jgi:hypothetical protein
MATTTMKLMDPTTGLAQCTACGATHRIHFRRGWKADGWAWYCLKRAGHGKPAGWRSPARVFTKEPITEVTKEPITTIIKDPPSASFTRS